MVEYLIRVDCEFGSFFVHAGHKLRFAEAMCATFMLRSSANLDIPHTKLLVEMHIEEKDEGKEGPALTQSADATFNDYEESYNSDLRKELDKTQEAFRQWQLSEAEKKVDAAVKESTRKYFIRER
ncbi:MAG: hypothetical protein H6978_00420 [Gammaproteobacteria bacterium]|nr:hypothetical protein [Gammaproteobacteria bacterium]